MSEPSIKDVIKRLEEVEKRLTVSEDIEQIKQLQIRYLTAHTFNDGDGEAAGFADDATCLIGSNPPLIGKEAILKFTVGHADMLKSMARSQTPEGKEPIPTSGHFILHPVITVEGNKARGTWMQYCLTSDPLTMHLLYYVQAVYDVEYVKRDGKWHIYYMKWTPRSEPRGWGEHK